MNEQRFVIGQNGDLTRMIACVSALAKDGPVEMTVKRWRKKRSDPQNSMLWAIYQEILDKGGEAFAGWTRDDLHEELLKMHFGSDVKEAYGMITEKPLRRSSKLNTVEFSEYVEFILRTFAERGLYIQTREWEPA